MLQIIIDGSVSLVRPDADDEGAFWEWAAEHIMADVMDENADDHTPYQEWGGALVVETNYLADLVNGLRADGFKFG